MAKNLAQIAALIQELGKKLQNLDRRVRKPDPWVRRIIPEGEEYQSIALIAADHSILPGSKSEVEAKFVSNPFGDRILYA